MLHSPHLFEPLTDRAWDDDWIRARIRAIAADAEGAHDPDALWPAHEWDGWKLEPPLKGFYVGAAGAIWGLDVLARRGHAETGLDLPRDALHVLELWQTSPEFWPEEELIAERQASLFNGETGLLFVAWRLNPRPDLADRLLARIRESVGGEAIELMWGSPGVMLVARAMHDETGEERWLDAWRECADDLRARRDPDGLWTTRLYGETFRSLTPPHGLVGIVGALLAEPDPDLERETAAILADAAVVEDGRANWPSRPGQPLPSPEGDCRLQWCVGAPGMLIGAPYLDEELVVAGAETVWDAGPASMEKGSGICHGTAGNGYALLKAFERTQDERWLDRARRFAVHALEQVERRGTGRYSLFTGDVGVALFAADCLEARARYPVTDTLSD